MKALPQSPSTETINIPGVYVWEPPGKAISVRLSLDVVDRMLQDVMRGFGAVPKRGAEVGGVLLGRTTPGDKTVVTIDEYTLVPIEYKRSPSYLLSEEDARAFHDAVELARNGSDPLLRPVGYFRSHTRDGVGLGSEDLSLLDTYFPEPYAVALIVKPYATRVSQAGFYFRENGAFQSGLPLLEFPFRRRELDPDGAPPARDPRAGERSSFISRSRGVRERAPVSIAPPPDLPAPSALEFAAASPARAPEPDVVVAPAPELPASDFHFEPAPRKRTGWLWLPLSFIFLLLGLLLGFQTAFFMRPQLPPGSNDPYDLNITVTKNGNNLQIKWDRQSLAVRSAQRGLLTIEDGRFSKPVPLNSADLQSGSVVYPPYTDHVTLRLDVMVNGRDTVSETYDWHP
jgi:hypothetical protein